MDTYTGIFFIVGILAAVLLIGILRNRAEIILNFILRGLSGMLIAYFLNFFLGRFIPSVQIGYGPATFLTSAILGFPGVAVLLGINFYMIL
ncbi:MAG: pro-sigmaK processing inhibitor BofA family protein [Lachnospiraceae bacterium]|nr:pro-sigmaK processing inhibitor BofA family protein [Lachnospiraceae bacterium]